MTLPVFVVDTDALAGEVVELAGDEGRHAVVVRRLRVGEHLVVTDGRGQAADCEVTTLGKASLHAKVVVRRVIARAVPQLIVVQAIPKGDHAERAVDLLTEVGADVIVPWAAARNVVSWKGDRAAKALQRWRSTAVAAAKQSRRVWFPEVLDLHSTADVVELIAGAAASFVLHETARTPLAVVPVPEDLADGVGARGRAGGRDHRRGAGGVRSSRGRTCAARPRGAAFVVGGAGGALPSYSRAPAGPRPSCQNPVGL